jgi:SAM-dependent methyltransferase
MPGTPVTMMERSAEQVGVVSAQFPPDLLPVLRCSRDAGPLVIASEVRSGALGIVQACLRCRTCAAEYRIEDGIARLMKGTLAPEDEHEMAIRDAQHDGTPPDPFVPFAFGWRSELSDLLEIPPHLAELEPANRTVLEFGCGDGRLTMLMAQMGARILAVDFSINTLRALAWRLPSGSAPTAYQTAHRCSAVDLRGHVGLVQADASHFHVAHRSFERALSTTPLDSRDQRMAMYRTIANALTDDGRFVGSVEHDDLTRQLFGLPMARRYDNGIFIEHFEIETMRREAAPYFSKLRIRPIRPRVPFVRRLPLAWAVRVSRTVGAMPILRKLGEILLLRAECPVRPPVEGAKRRGSKLARSFFRWYMGKIGKDPLWEDNEPLS